MATGLAKATTREHQPRSMLPTLEIPDGAITFIRIKAIKRVAAIWHHP
ncbi:hypothetical protein ACFLYG_00605 [Chloroflexota bacterium]